MRFEIKHEVHHFDRSFMFISQTFPPPFREVSFTYWNKQMRIKVLRVVFCSKSVDLKKLVNDPCECTAYLQFECNRCKL